VFDAAGAGQTVLAPNTELAAALFDAVERMHVSAGNQVWPTPRIRDFGGWLRERYAERQLSDPSLPRALSDIEERELWRSVILESDSGDQFLEPAGAARSARRARRAMFEHGIPASALAAYATEESLALSNWNRKFEERCRDLGCIASDQLLSDRMIGCTRIDSRNLVWIESPIWRPVARRWLETCAVEIFPPDATTAAALLRRLHAPSPAAELAAIAEWARENLRSAPNFRAWVCIPDLNLRRGQVLDAFDAALAPQRFSLTARDTGAPYAVAGGTPLSGYAPVHAALSALAASTGSVSFENFSALLRMPELQASPADASAAAVLDIALRNRGPSEADLNEWLRLSENLLRETAGRPVVALQRLRIFLRTLEDVRGDHRLSRWVSVWDDAFQAGPWSERHRWSSTEFQSAERFRELLAALATADAVFGARSAASAGRVLQRAARDTAFQAQTGIPPIWVSGQLMDPWLTYDGLWIAGCTEERWPPPPDPVPLLPVKLQREYGVASASAESQLQLAEDLQRRWQFRAAHNVFSCADSGDGRFSTFSPLLPAVPLADAEPAITQPHWHAVRTQAPLLEMLIDEQAPRFAQGPKFEQARLFEQDPPFATSERTRGVATLRAQSQCAFRGFATTRLVTEELGRPVPGFNVRERGEMLHRALEQIWSALRTQAELQTIEPARREDLINESVVRAIAKQCERRDPGLRWRRREVPRLGKLLGKWLETELLREPFEVEYLEQGEQTARHGGLEFKVRIDRVDRLADGGRVLIDYKTGMATPDWRGDRPENPQLPIYALLRPARLVAVAYGKVNASECCFVAETERGGIFKARGRPSSMEDMPNFSALIAKWSQRIEKIAAEFAAGNAAVAPTLRACASCGLQPLCRIPPVLDDGENLDE
jgi:ATP-dependent helicase/nuclease subunit B